MAITSSALRQLSDGNSVGNIFGQSTTDLIGFYGATTAVSQYVVSTAIMQSISSGALASSLAVALNRLGLVNVSTILP